MLGTARLGLAGSLARRVRRLGSSFEFRPLDVKRMNQARAAARPPELPARLVKRQAKPALANARMANDFLIFKVDQRQVMGVEPAVSDEGVLAVGQGNNVERKIGENHLIPRRGQCPPIGKQEALVGLAGITRSVWGFGCVVGSCLAEKRQNQQGDRGTSKHGVALSVGIRRDAHRSVDTGRRGSKGS